MTAQLTPEEFQDMTPEEKAYYQEFLEQEGVTAKELADIETTRIRIYQSQTKKSSLPEGCEHIKPGWFYAPTGLFHPREEIVATILDWLENAQWWEQYDPKSGDQHPWCFRTEGGGYDEGVGYPAKEIGNGTWVPDRENPLICSRCPGSPFLNDGVTPFVHPHQDNPKLGFMEGNTFVPTVTCASVRLFGLAVFDALDSPTKSALPGLFSIGKLFYTKEAKRASTEVNGKTYVSFQKFLPLLASKITRLSPNGIRPWNAKVLIRTVEIQTESGNAYLPVFRLPDEEECGSLMKVLHLPSTIKPLRADVKEKYMLPAAAQADRAIPETSESTEPYNPIHTGPANEDTPPADDPFGPADEEWT